MHIDINLYYYIICILHYSYYPITLTIIKLYYTTLSNNLTNTPQSCDTIRHIIREKILPRAIPTFARPSMFTVSDPGTGRTVCRTRCRTVNYPTLTNGGARRYLGIFIEVYTAHRRRVTLCVARSRPAPIPSLRNFRSCKGLITAKRNVPLTRHKGLACAHSPRYPPPLRARTNTHTHTQTPVSFYIGDAPPIVHAPTQTRPQIRRWLTWRASRWRTATRFFRLSILSSGGENEREKETDLPSSTRRRHDTAKPPPS